MTISERIRAITIDLFNVHSVDLKFACCSERGCSCEMFPFSPPETSTNHHNFKNHTDCNILDYAQ